MKTLEHQLIATKGHSTGFDYLRHILAVSVIAFHTILICYGRQVEIWFWTSPFKPFFYFLVPGFFTISGFLVTRSLERVDYHIPSFLILRGLRIMPALCCVVFISAFILGPAMTELSLGEYFSDKFFYQYFLNIIGSAHYRLPGVFTHALALNIVDLQIWTLPYELLCYALMAFLTFVKVIKHRKLFLAATILFTVFMYMNDWYSGHFFFKALSPGPCTISCFAWGAIFYQYRDKIPYNANLFKIALFAAWVALSYSGGAHAVVWWGLAFSDMVYVASLPMAYITVYLGLMNPKKIFPVSSGDYSYGLYLYGFPAQQVIYQLFPFARVWYLHIPLSLLLAASCAYLSWTFLESKILSKKKEVLKSVHSLFRKNL